METFYIPIDRRLALAKGYDLPVVADGVVLFADISGFTPLTAVLTQELGSRRGAEEVTHYLNMVYSKLIASVHQLGGSVIGFSGDAITCWFAEDETAVSPAAHRAVSAAFAMQETMTQFRQIMTPAKKAISFGIKIALAGGQTKRFLVGDPKIQLVEVLAGRVLDRVAQAEQIARQGEIVVDDEVRRVVETAVSWRPHPHSHSTNSFFRLHALKQSAVFHPWPSNIQVSADTARLWLHSFISERLQQGLAQFLAELRPVTTLFLNFSGIEYDTDPDAGQKLDTFVRQIQTYLQRYEGTLLQLTMGDKGSYLYAAFGVPVAHEDDVTRAILFAQEMMAYTNESSYIQQVRVGISQGLLYAGTYGSEVRQTYGVLGHDVNMAARLMMIAQPGQIILPQRVAEQAKDRFTFRKLAPVLLKGQAETVELAEVGARQETAVNADIYQKKPPLIGRDKELQTLLAELEQLPHEQSARVIIIEGDAGVGKSRLLYEFIEHLRVHQQIAWFIGEGDAVEQSTPYFAWRSVLAQLLNIKDKETANWGESILNAFEQIDPTLVPMLPALNILLPAELPETEAIQQMAGEARARLTNELFIRLLRAKTADSPPVIILEDVHWLDSSSWELTRQIVRQIPQLMLVLVTRPLTPPLPDSYTFLTQLPQTRRIILNTLPAESIEELIRQRLKVSVLPKSVVELVHSRAEGNPFFTEEVVFMLLDQGVIRIRDKVCEIVSPDLKRLQFPSTVRGIITSRVDKLEPREQLTLKVASVIGRAFSYRVLYDVHPVPDDRPLLRHYLDDLQQRNITLLETPEPNLSYLFKHAITWETVYDLMTFSQRHEFHRQVALWYEHTYAENLTSYYPLLVYHWQRAEDWEKTRDYLEKAGTQALTNYANEEAVQFFSQVLELADTGRVQVSLATKAEWLVALAEALFNLGDILESQKILEKALAALGWPVPAGNGRFAFSLLSQTIQQIWHRLRRYGYHNRLSSETQQQIRRAVYAYELYGRNSYFMDDTRHLLYASIRGLNLAEQGGPSLELARAYSVMSVIAGVIPLHRLARFYAQRAVEIINSTHDKTTRSFVLSRVNIYNIGAGLWSSVREQVAQAIQDADELGAKTQWLESVGILAWFNNFAGNYDDGFHWGQVYHQWSETIGNERSIVWGLTLQAFARLHQGKIQEAIPLLEEGYAFSGQHEDRIAQIINQGVLAQAYFLAGDVDKAWKIGHKTFALMSESPLPAAFTAFDGYLALAEMLLDLQETYQESAKQIPASELDSMIKQTSKWLNGFARRYPICVPGALRIAGRVAWLEGNRQKAFRLWRKSLARATAIGMPYDEGIVHLELGRRLDVSNSARIYHLQMAYENLARIHADYGLRMVEKSLALESR